jgi:uncharacterized protein YndB with AHSA1/START domain
MSTDRIEKSVFLQAPRARVWRALSNVEEFGDWFGVKLNGSFAPGARLSGKVTHKGYENYPFEFTIDRIEPERKLSWHWHPNAVDPKTNYSTEPKTLVVFELEDAPGGTNLTVTESGFDKLPSSRRNDAYQGNEKGWIMQMDSIQQHIKRAA